MAGVGSGGPAIAKAVRGDFGGGASAVTTGAGGTIVGWVVSNTTALGHLWREWIRMIERSMSAEVAPATTAFGMYQSIRNRSASSRLPTNAK